MEYVYILWRYEGNNCMFEGAFSSLESSIRYCPKKDVYDRIITFEKSKYADGIWYSSKGLYRINRVQLRD